MREPDRNTMRASTCALDHERRGGFGHTAQNIIDARSPAERQAAALSLLRRTYCSPDGWMARARIVAVEALAPPLAEADAERLVDETLAWLDVVRARDSSPSDDDAEVRRAISLSRDVLLRTSESAAPLERFAMGISERALRREVATCTPTDDEAAAAAVLRYAYELSELPARVVAVGDRGCVAVQTLGGLLSAGDVAETRGPIVTVGPSTMEELTFEPPWPDAPTRVFSVEWYAGPLNGEGTQIVVQRVDGLWRVVYEQIVWIS
jgi:hypothetical protein